MHGKEEYESFMPGAVHTSHMLTLNMSTEALGPCCTLYYLPESTLSHCNKIGFVVWWHMYTSDA